MLHFCRCVFGFGQITFVAMQQVWFLKPIYYCLTAANVGTSTHALTVLTATKSRSENTNYLWMEKARKISLIHLHTHHHHDCRVSSSSLILECLHAHVNEMPLAFIYPSNWLICSDLFKWQMDKLQRTNQWNKNIWNGITTK